MSKHSRPVELRGIYTQTCHVCGHRGDCRLNSSVVVGRNVWVCTPDCPMGVAEVVGG